MQFEASAVAGRFSRRRWLGIALAAGMAATVPWARSSQVAAETPALPDSPDALLGLLRAGHPRLVLTDDGLETLRPQFDSDPTLQRYRDALVRRGEQILTQAPAERVLIGPRLLTVSRRVLDRIYTLSLLFRLDADERWANRARDELLAVVNTDRLSFRSGHRSGSSTRVDSAESMAHLTTRA